MRSIKLKHEDERGGTIIQILSLFFTLTPVVLALTFCILTILQKSEISNQYIVYTGLRTMDMSYPNLFPVATSDLDVYTRTYGCMMDAEIYTDTKQCDTQPSIKGYQKCVAAFVPQPPRSPSMTMSMCNNILDYRMPGYERQFLECVMSVFDLTAKNVNVFTSCMDLSQRPTFNSIQNVNSEVFLGSYNYAVLLVDALVIMASFLVVTSGGLFHYGSFYRNPGKDNHITGFWSPFSIYRILVAWIWNFVFLVGMVIVSFSNTANNANSDDDSKRFPLTLWTCGLSIGMLGLSVLYYTTYLFQWLYAGQYFLYPSMQVLPAAESQDDVAEKAQAGAVPSKVQTADSGMNTTDEDPYPWRKPEDVVNVPPGNFSTLPPGDTSRLPRRQYYQRYARRETQWDSVENRGRRLQPPPDPRYFKANLYSVNHFNPGYYASALTHRFPNMVGGRYGHYLGVQLYDNVEDDANVTLIHIMPLMVQAYAWTWVFTDGLFFVGMITPQSSISNEAVVRVFTTVIAARLFQLAGAYLIRKAFLTNQGVEIDESKAGVVLASIMNHVASIVCLVAVSLDFMSTLGFAENARFASDRFLSAQTIQIGFLVFVFIIPELWRTVNISIMTNRVYNSVVLAAVPLPAEAGENDAEKAEKVQQKAFDENGEMLMSYEALFAYEWIVRSICALIALTAFAPYLRDENAIVSNFLFPKP